MDGKILKKLRQELEKNKYILLERPKIPLTDDEFDKLEEILICAERNRSGGPKLAKDNSSCFYEIDLQTSYFSVSKQSRVEYEEEITEIIESDEMINLYKKFTGADEVIINSPQVNILNTQCWIGRHRDIDYENEEVFNIVIQLGKIYDGGEFVIYLEEKLQEVWLPYRSMLIFDLRFEHEVKKVIDGERRTLVYSLDC